MSGRLPLSRVLAGASLLLLSSCDGGGPTPPSSVLFNGVTYHPLGQATLSVEGGALEVENIGTSGTHGVRVDVADGSLDTLGVEIRSLTLGSGARWGLDVFGNVGGTRTSLAAAWAEDLGGGINEIRVSFVGGIGLDQVIFEYLLDGVLVVRSPPVAPFAATVASGGSSNLSPNSVHAVREGGVVVVGTDYRAEGLRGGGAAGRGCVAALIQVAFQPDPVCSDYVRAVPLAAGGAAMPDVTSAEVGGRGISRFVITDGTVE